MALQQRKQSTRTAYLPAFLCVYTVAIASTVLLRIPLRAHRLPACHSGVTDVTLPAYFVHISHLCTHAAICYLRRTRILRTATGTITALPARLPWVSNDVARWVSMLPLWMDRAYTSSSPSPTLCTPVPPRWLTAKTTVACRAAARGRLFWPARLPHCSGIGGDALALYVCARATVAFPRHSAPQTHTFF